MAEYIDREALYERITALPSVDCAAIYRGDVETAIKEANAAEVAEVVRCKDCKHFKPQNISAHWHSTERYCMRKVAIKVNEDDFCSYGAKMDGKENAE